MKALFGRILITSQGFDKVSLEQAIQNQKLPTCLVPQKSAIIFIEQIFHCETTQIEKFITTAFTIGLSNGKIMMKRCQIGTCHLYSK